MRSDGGFRALITAQAQSGIAPSFRAWPKPLWISVFHLDSPSFRDLVGWIPIFYICDRPFLQCPLFSLSHTLSLIPVCDSPVWDLYPDVLSFSSGAIARSILEF